MLCTMEFLVKMKKCRLISEAEDKDSEERDIYGEEMININS